MLNRFGGYRLIKQLWIARDYAMYFTDQLRQGATANWSFIRRHNHIIRLYQLDGADF